MLEEVLKEVPGYNGLVCSEDGRFFDSITGAEIEQAIGFFGNYYVINWAGETVTCHRLLGMAWLPKPELDYELLQINHIDGNKLNNAVPNLEWVTPSQNRQHALEIGLAPRTAVLVKDLRSGEIIRYLSINECSRETGIPLATIHKYVNGEPKIRRLFYIFIKEGSEWPNFTENDIGKNPEGLPTIVRLENPVTGIIHYGKTIASAAGIIGVRADTLYVWLKNNNGKDKLYHGWNVKFITDYSALEKTISNFRKKFNLKGGGRKQYGYRVTNLETNKTQDYASADELCMAIGTNRNNLRCIMSRLRGFWKNYRFEYLHKVK